MDRTVHQVPSPVEGVPPDLDPKARAEMHEVAVCGFPVIAGVLGVIEILQSMLCEVQSGFPG